MQNQQQGKGAVEKSPWMRGNGSRMEGGGRQIEAWGSGWWGCGGEGGESIPSILEQTGLRECVCVCVGGGAMETRGERADPPPSPTLCLIYYSLSLSTRPLPNPTGTVCITSVRAASDVFNNGSANISVLQPALPRGNDERNGQQNTCERTHLLPHLVSAASNSNSFS